MDIKVGATNLQTRDGKPVRVYAIDCGPGDEAIHGATKTSEGWKIDGWRADGRYFHYAESQQDIIEIPENNSE